MPKFFKSLFGQVVLALLVGVALGMLAPELASKLKPLGDGFIKLIKMLVPAIVFCVVVGGIAGAGNLKKVGRVGIKAILYFEVVTTLALLLGLVMAHFFSPGTGMNIDPRTLDATAMSSYVDSAQHIKSGGAIELLLHIIPTTIFSGFNSGDILQVLLVSILFGCALSMIGAPVAPVVLLIDKLSQTVFRMMGFIIKLAPLGVLGAVAFTVGKYGVGSLRQLSVLVLLYFVTVAIFVCGILGLILRQVAGISIFKLIRYMREELMIVLGTTSADSVLPQVMHKLERLGISASTVGLVVPTGYSFNLDAFSIYLTLATVFIAQATNTPLSSTDLLAILGVALLTSKGAHGVPGSAIVILAATLSSIPAIPAIGLVLVLSVDWFIGIARALGNLLGNCAATVVVAAWEKDLDVARARRVLDGELPSALPDAQDQAGSPDLAG